MLMVAFDLKTVSSKGGGLVTSTHYMAHQQVTYPITLFNHLPMYGKGPFCSDWFIVFLDHPYLVDHKGPKTYKKKIEFQTLFSS
jgi:hypothetical protein